MDHSIHILNLEECGSCESGWTMYIASSIHDDHEDAEGCSYGGDTHQITKYDDGDVSDDSMASDASSGPSHPKQIPDDLEGSHRVYYLDDHINSCKKPKIIDKKRGGDGIINVKDVDLVKEAPCRAAPQMDEGERNQKRGEIGDVL